MMRRRVGLALSGGALRGIAHVGALLVLEREGIPIDCIAGTSAGSAVGAAFAAGLRGERLVEMALKVRWRYVARPAWSRYGLLSFARLERLLVRTLGDLTFADLKIPYAAVVADLETSQPLILREGRVARAVRASCSIPGLVTPVEWDGHLVVDGGVVNNLPISVVRGLGADLVIAVDLSRPQGRRPGGIGDITLWTVETLISRAGDDPRSADVYIPIPLVGWGSLLRASTARSTLAKGQEAAEKALPEIKAALNGQYAT